MNCRKGSKKKHLFPLSRRVSFAIAVGSLLFSAAALVPLLKVKSDAAGAPLIIPVALFGYFFGVPAGVIVGLINVAVYAGLLLLMGRPGVHQTIDQWPGVLISLAFGVTAGFLGKLVSRIRLQGKQLREAREGLEAKVAERTVELRDANELLSRELVRRKWMEEERSSLEARLLQAQKLESVGILAGGVAHDFNNILQMICGYTRLVLADKTDAHPDCPSLRVIEAASERAMQLTRQLLLFSRQEESKPQTLDLNAQVWEVIRLLERTIPRMIVLEARLAADVKSVAADAGQIQQVIMNLSLNARDAMPEGGRLLFATRNTMLDEDFARKHPGAVPGEHVMLSVTDTGMGMDAETRQRIFDPFFTTKEIGKGTGLGLAVAYGIVISHHGYIRCHSELGKGTTFDVFLPASAQPRDEAGAPAPEVNDREIRGGSETILIVDDDAHIQRWQATILSREGYSMVTASTGEEGLLRYAESAPDLVILDLNMPGMGGIQFLHELLCIDPEADVIIASGYTGDLLHRDLLDRGARAVVPKPFTAEMLLRKTREVLDGREEPKASEK
jgi:signal transduction histidine kinase/ActR/RegA family two-component response regulator